MDPKILRRTLTVYTLMIGIFLMWAIAYLFHVDLPSPEPDFCKTSLIVYIVAQLVFLKDLLYRRTLTPDEQFQWVLGFLVFHIFAFWRYYNRFIKPLLKATEA